MALGELPWHCGGRPWGRPLVDEAPSVVNVYNRNGACIAANCPVPLHLGASHGLPPDLAVIISGPHTFAISALPAATGEHCLWLCMEDLAYPVPLFDGMNMRCGHMTRGPVVHIGMVGTSVHLTQNGATTVKEPGSYVVGRPMGRGGHQDRYDLIPEPDIATTISRTHAILAFESGRWWLKGHPDRPPDEDLVRERSTWLRLEPGQEYPLPVGARDAKVGLCHITAPILLEVFSPLNSVDIKVTAISGDLLCTRGVRRNGSGRDLINDVAASIGIHPMEMKLVYGTTQIFEDLPLRTVFGGAAEAEYDVALVRIEKRGFTELLERVRVSGPRVLHDVSEKEEQFLRDRRFAGMAVSIDGHALAYMALELLDDYSLLESAIRNKASAITHVPPALVDKRLSLLAVEGDPSVFVYVLAEFQSDPELIAASVGRRAG